MLSLNTHLLLQRAFRILARYGTTAIANTKDKTAISSFSKAR
uniref:Uncharacterized protein n=1 Tax=Arundo donax TaxID=35708 RepID=A0A0A9GGG8_ARUDO